MSLKKRPKSHLSFTGLLAFESVARHMNFARAALELQVTPTAMSKTVKLLEVQLGVRLFNRTTRSVSLTEHGSQLLRQVIPALNLITQSVEQIGEAAANPKGLLRINTSHSAFASIIEPWQADFIFDDELVDIVTNTFDAGIRRGPSVQRDMISVALGGPQRAVVVASPAYLEKHGTAKSPRDLLGHNCIRQRFGSHGRFFEWRFKSRSKRFVIDVTGNLIFSEMRCVINAARQGIGVGYVFQQLADDYIQNGELVAILEEQSATYETFCLYYPNRAQMPGKLRVFIEHLKSRNNPSRPH
jgi:DNA-binding transcriptional LysR family regulator